MPETLLSRQRERVMDAAAQINHQNKSPLVKEQGAEWELRE